MEQRFEEISFDILLEEDHWLRSLASAGLATPEGSEENARKIIVLNKALWSRAKHTDPWSTKTLQIARFGTSILLDRRQSEGSPPQPVEFLEALRRRQNREHASMIKVGPFSVPVALQHIAERVDSSRSIVGASDDGWDDGAEEVKDATWLRAAHYVLKVSTAFWRARRISPPVPTISAGPDGSVDVVWRHRHRSLLLNVPEEPESVVTFSGLDRQSPDSRFRGEEDIAGNGEWILGWLVR